MVMSGLEALSSGQAVLTGQDTTELNEDALAGLRRDNVGIVFQAFRLIPSMTALQNVAVPLELSGQADAKIKAREALSALGLGHRLNHLPTSCPAVSNSVWRLPGRLPRARKFCWQMSRQEIWTVPPANG